jgi:hypothetical protein
MHNTEGDRARFTLTTESHHTQQSLESCLLLSTPGNTLAGTPFTEISYLERFTKNPEQEFERTGLIDPARGGTILLRFPVSRVVRNDQSTDEISSEEP